VISMQLFVKDTTPLQNYKLFCNTPSRTLSQTKIHRPEIF